MEGLKAKWASLTLFEKLKTVALIVPILLILLTGGYEAVVAFLDKLRRKSVDAKDAEIEKQRQETRLAEATQEGKIQEIKSEKEKAKDAASKQDPADFHNKRNDP